MSAFETASYLPERPGVGVLRRGIGGVHRNSSRQEPQQLCGVGAFAAEIVSASSEPEADWELQ